MNTWTIISYIFLGCATIVLIFAAYIFFGILLMTSQIPIIGQSLTSVALAASVPYLVLAAIMYVIGGVSYYAGQGYVAQPFIPSNKPEMTADSILDRLKRLEGIVDNNFAVVSKRLDEIEEKQNMASQNTLIKAKKE